MSLKTPALRAKGLYTLLTPWVAETNVLYECVAIRRFTELERAGVDVFAAYYEPKSLLRSKYEDDLAAGASIVTLISATHLTIEVPDTYIESYPQSDYVPYHTVILSLSLGPVADSVDLTFLKQQIAGTVSDVYGFSPTVNTHTLPTDTMVTPLQHEALEAARQAAITIRKTDRAKVIELQQQLAATQAKLAGLEDYILSINPPP